MSAIGCPPARRKRLSLQENSRQGLVTQIRLQLKIAEYYPLEAMLTHFRSEQGLTVNITSIRIEENAHQHLDLEIQGTISQISNGLNYLQSLDLEIRGKPNTEGDSWYC